MEMYLALTTDTMRRLAIARHLFKNGMQQMRASDSLAALSILPFHDALEMFLQLSCEIKGGVMPKNPDFDAYWVALKNVGIDLTAHLASMRRLNKIRVAVKHNGILPDRNEVTGFSALIENFFLSATPTVFGVEFHSITRSFLISDEAQRSLLNSAENALQGNDFAESLEHLMRAFLRATTYEGSHASYDPRGRIFNINFFNFGIANMENKKTANALKDLSDTFGEALMIVGYQLDFDGYRLLRTHGPVIYMPFSENSVVQWVRPVPDDRRVVERCLDFVIDVCLRFEPQ